MYNYIAVAIDGSDNALRATAEAIRLASTPATIELIYVIDVDHIRQEVLHATSPDALMLARRQKIAPYEALVQQAHRNVKITILKGLPGPSIVDYVNTRPVDIIVIGSRGLNAFQQMVLGSVSHKVMKRATCPVLVVK